MKTPVMIASLLLAVTFVGCSQETEVYKPIATYYQGSFLIAGRDAPELLLDAPHTNYVCAKVRIPKGTRVHREESGSYEVWLTEGDWQAGKSPWLNKSTLIGMANEIRAVSGFNLDKQGESFQLSLAPDMRSRHVVLYPPLAMLADVSSGRAGLIHVSISTQQWAAIAKGEKLKSLDGGSLSSTHALASLSVGLSLSNSTPKEQSLLLDLALAPKNNVLLASFLSLSSLDTNAHGIAKVTLRGHESRTVTLETPMTRVDDLRTSKPLRIVSVEHGWDFPMRPLPADKDLFK